jgi:HPt (histidine-containing phosphotransfer) domain-containing protein
LKELRGAKKWAPKKETMGTKDPIDFASALERIGNDESFLKELLDLYILTFESKREELSVSLERKDFKALREVGHSLKGSSANLSLIPLQELAYRIETAGREEDIVAAGETLTLLDQEFKRLKEFILEKSS